LFYLITTEENKYIINLDPGMSLDQVVRDSGIEGDYTIQELDTLIPSGNIYPLGFEY
jgi:hypothetical protein